MNINKKPVISLLFLTVMLITFVPHLVYANDWQETVKRHLGTFMIFDRLVVELRAQFDSIEQKEKGAAALIMAYSYDQLNKQRAVTPPPDFAGYFSKSQALKNRDVSHWLKRYVQEFGGKDNKLLFLSPDREDIRLNILRFATESKKFFPSILLEGKISGLENFLKIKLRIRTSAACGFEIYGQGGRLLDEGVLKRGSNERIIQLLREGKDGKILYPVGKARFLRVVVFNRYVNEKKFTFTVPVVPGTPVESQLAPGKELKLAGKEKRLEKERPAHYRLKRKWALPNLATGFSLFLLNSLVINHSYNSDSVHPYTKADLDVTRKVLETISFGLIAKSLAHLMGGPGESPAAKRTHFGLFYKIYGEHSYDLYREGLRESKLPGNFSESDISAAVLFPRGYEIEVFSRRLEAADVMVAGGKWTVNSSLIGVNVGKVFTLVDRNRRLLFDFSGGPFFARIFNRDYTYLDLVQDDMVTTHGNKISYGLYSKIQLRFDIFKKKKLLHARLPVLTVGLKYFFPFNNFEFHRSIDKTFRLKGNSFLSA